ncbi:tandem-95 repeat protein [Frigoribacterium sp. VKM Ac-2530]|uniref:Ig-like domain-containing protein n=1 Tax=Frigoribacterium sp. VKM Ac-2530 TaxID=2783822 RepID=UPI001889C693|nr:tandem-95 repeat protein [Frigoribacterium sp. VKM Ac-2530]
MTAAHRARPRPPLKKWIAATTAVVLATGGAALIAPQMASAAEPFPVSGLYATQSSRTSPSSNILSVDRATGTATTVLTVPGQDGGAAPVDLNQIGVSGDGKKLFLTNPDFVFEYTAKDESWKRTPRTPGAAVGTTMGGVDPKSGRFFFGGQSGSTFSFASYDPATGTVASDAVTVTAPNPPGGNGDLTFDRQGNLYFISSSSTLAQLYRVDAADLGGGATTAVEVGPPITPTAALNSLAFGDDGYLYVAGTGTNGFLKVDPVTGKTLERKTVSVAITDLGSRAAPSTGQVEAAFSGDRHDGDDQFTVTLGGGGITKEPSATTSPDGDPATAGPIILLPGQEYTVTQTPGNATTDPADYSTSYTCKNLVDGTTVSEGKGSSASFTVPAAGGDVKCSFANPLKPVVADSTSTGNRQGQPVTVDVLKGATGDPDASTLALTAPAVPGSTLSSDSRTLTVPGEGVWTVDRTTGAVTFTPEKGATRNPTPVTYTVANAAGGQATGQVAVTYVGVAEDDAVTTGQGTAVTVDPLRNDQGTLDPTSVVFPATGQPAGSTLTDGGRTLAVPGQGVWTIDRGTGAVTFTPDPQLRGDASPVTYRVSDADGTTSTATITASVTAVAPVASADTGSTSQNTPVTVDVVRNDRPGVAGGTPLAPGSVVFPAAGQPTDSVVSGDGRTLTVPREGVYTIDPSTGAVTFTPQDGFTGTATPVTYRVSDTGGETATGSLTVAVDAVAPVAAPDTASTQQGSPVTVDVLATDAAGNPMTPLDRTSVVFPAGGQPNGAVVSAGGRTLTVPDQGVHTVDPKTGDVTFTPVSGFRGEALPVSYRVSDVDGSTATSSLTVTVTAVGPQAAADTASTDQNTPVAIDVTTNDRPGVAGGTPVDPATVVFTDAGQPTGAVVSDGGRGLTVPGEGTWTVDRASGVVTFTPEQGFAGTTSPVTYQVSDEGGETATARVTVTVAAVAPTAAPDAARTPAGTPVTLDPLRNDVAGNAATPIDPTSVRLADPSGALVTTLVVAGQGTFSVDTTTGAITFAPEAGFSGDATAPYAIADVDGGTSASTVTVTVGTPPTTVADRTTTRPGTPVTVDVAGNDGPGSSPLDPGSVRLVDPATGTLVTTVTVPGEGTYDVGTDGRVTFTPAPGHTGTSTITYSVAGEDGGRATGELTITVEAAAADPAPASPVESALAFTGSDGVLQAALAAVALMLAGVTVVVVRRRRGTES